ncbi:hypothetical protein VCHA53O466_140182 [Vibrio chagasii]|nr:hypothetical protein VCHA53O466_140182 [Vibrio chagasii]
MISTNLKTSFTALTLASIMAGCGGSDGSDGGGGTTTSKLVGNTEGAVAFGFSTPDASSMRASEQLSQQSFSGDHCDNLVRVTEAVNIDDETGEVELIKVFDNMSNGYCYIDNMHIMNDALLLKGTFNNLADINGDAIDECKLVKMPLNSRISAAECLIYNTDDISINAINYLDVSQNGEHLSINYLSAAKGHPIYNTSFVNASLTESGFKSNAAFWGDTFTGEQKSISGNNGTNIFRHEYASGGTTLKAYKDNQLVEDLEVHVSDWVSYSMHKMGNFAQLTSYGDGGINESKLISLDDLTVTPSSMNDPLTGKAIDFIFEENFIEADNETIFFASTEEDVNSEFISYAYSFNHLDGTISHIFEFEGAIHGDADMVNIQHTNDTIVYWKTDDSNATHKQGVIGYNITDREPLRLGANLVSEFSDWVDMTTRYTANGFVISGQDSQGVNRVKFYNTLTDEFTSEEVNDPSLGGSIPLMPSSPSL